MPQAAQSAHLPNSAPKVLFCGDARHGTSTGLRKKSLAPVGDDVVEEEDAAKRHLAGDHVALHVDIQLLGRVLLIHLHIPAEAVWR